MGFYGFCVVHKALGLMEMGPHEATQGELQGELLVVSEACVQTDRHTNISITLLQ